MKELREKAVEQKLGSELRFAVRSSGTFILNPIFYYQRDCFLITWTISVQPLEKTVRSYLLLVKMKQSLGALAMMTF